MDVWGMPSSSHTSHPPTSHLHPHQPGDPACPARVPARPHGQPCHPQPGGSEPALPAALQHPGHMGPALPCSGPGGPRCAAATPLRWAGQESGDTPFCPLGCQWASGTKTPLALILGTGWWLVANEDQQTAWFPAPYLEEVALGQGRDGERSLGSSGETNPPPHTHHHGAVFSKAESQEACKPGE